MSRRRPLGPPTPPPLPPGRVVDLAGRGETLVREAGAAGAPPVLLLHGWLATADLNFFPAYAPLAAAHHVLALDQRGHGRGILTGGPPTLADCADDAAALLRLAGTGPAVVVGYSLGGAVAQLLADRHPDVVAGVVLAATTTRFRGLLRRSLIEHAGWQAAGRTLTAGRLAGRWLGRRAARHAPEVQPLQAWMAAELERHHPAEARLLGRDLGRFDGTPIAERRRGTLPVTSLVTTGDHPVKPHQQRAAALAWAAEVVELAADHDAPGTAPGPFGAALADAVARTWRRRGDEISKDDLVLTAPAPSRAELAVGTSRAPSPAKPPRLD